MNFLLSCAPMARLLTVAATALCCAGAFAQAFPTRPIKLIAPYAAGGPTDVMARLVAGEMSKVLGQPVVVENRPGAAGALGADVVAKSPPDGYTVCFCTTGSTVIMPLLEPRLPYKAADLVPVGQVHRLELSLLLGPKIPAKNLAEFIAYARANPGKITFASPGTGSPNHLAGEMLKALTGIDIVHVAYRGEHPAMVDLIGGQVDMMVGSVFIGDPQVRAGKVRMIAVTGPARAPRHPDIPTVGETVPDYQATSHVGLHVPPGTPREAIDRLNAAMVAAVGTPAVTEKFLSDGITPIASRPEAYAQWLREETARWTRVVRQNGIKLD